MNLYWADFHKHLAEIDKAEEIINSAKVHLDIYPVLCYPFKWIKKSGSREETVKQRPEFYEWWHKLKDVAKRHNKPGQFITLLGYEWHGNRTYYGDNNIIYFNLDKETVLDDTWELEKLYSKLINKDVLIIPHHTGYQVRNRGKDWNVFESSISPVMEIYSQHGSSEGVGTPLPLSNNNHMGPRTSGGTFIDALNRGYQIGVIASNDGAGLPGSWSQGVAGIWADKLSRKSIKDAIDEKRTIAVTGDRISLWWTLNGKPMGSELIYKNGNLRAQVNVETSQPLDRIELIHNGRVEQTYLHKDRWNIGIQKPSKILVEFGWGPTLSYGFSDVDLNWKGEVKIKGGDLISVEPRFNIIGQYLNLIDSKRCSFNIKTSTKNKGTIRQGLIFEINGEESAKLMINTNNHEFQIALKEAVNRDNLFVFIEETRKKFQELFGINPESVENPDIYYHNSPKIKVHPLYPEESYKVQTVFANLDSRPGLNYYYLRVQQIDGQMAWSSPIWVKK